MKIIDVHTHAFPDFLAQSTLKKIGENLGEQYSPSTDGTIDGLLSSMDEVGISRSFDLNIATRPEHTQSMITWSHQIASERIVPIGSIHTQSQDWANDIDNLISNGFKGIKFHPLYQNHIVDDERLDPIYDYLSSKMFVIFHSGLDLMFPGDTRSSVERIVRVQEKFPKLKMIAAHLGGWGQWDKVLDLMCGKDIFFDTSFAHEVDQDLVQKIMLKHDRNRFLFGSDTPWGNQKKSVEYIKSLSCIDDDFKELIFYKNINNLF